MPNALGISDEEYAQLQFYASMMNPPMSVEQYVQYMDKNAGPQKQAPQNAYEAGGGYEYFDPRDPDNLRETYNEPGGSREQGKTFKQHVAEVEAANPPGTIRYYTGDPRNPTALRNIEDTPVGGQIISGGYHGVQTPAMIAANGGAGGPGGLDAAAADTNRQISSIIDAEEADQRNYWSNNVDSSLGAQRSAVANQQTANRLAETQSRANATTLEGDLARTQAQRTQGIQRANAEQTAAMNQLLERNNAANQQATAAAAGLNRDLSNISRNQSAANDALGRQLQGINAEQSAANAALGRSHAASNDLAWGATDEFGNQVAQSNYDANLAAQRLGDALYEQSQQGQHYVEGLEDQIWALNYEDQLATNRYMDQTNPLLAEMKARGSDEKYVKQQQDIFDEYKALSKPEINAQERFLAELARRKTEGDERGSREATYQAMRQRGLNSGGQQIAAQLANRQATSQDRVLAELGLAASAVERSERNRAGATDVAAQLRGADDAMRQFQDQYAFNDANRRQGVMQGQADTQLRSTNQRGQRSAQLFDAQRANLNDASNRTGMTYDAESGTINANSNRNAQLFDARSNTINSNSNRDMQTFDASTRTNEGNSNRNIAQFDATTATNAGNTQRSGMGFDATRGVINDNSARDGTSYNARTGTNEANFGRDSYGWDTGDANAQTNYTARQTPINMSVQNRANEVGSAAGMTGSSLAAAGGYNQMTGNISSSRQTALKDVLGQKYRSAAIAVGSEEDEDEN